MAGVYAIYNTTEAPKRHFFTSAEKKFIKETVMSHSIIVNNKVTDGPTNALRNQIWDKITMQFNSKPEFNKRNKKQLKKLWENMKMDQKRMAKRVQLLTGRDPDTDRASKELSYMTDTGPYSVESEHENPSNEFSAEDLEEKPEPVFMHGVNWNHFQSTDNSDTNGHHEDSEDVSRDEETPEEEHKTEIKRLLIEEHKEKVKLARLKTKEQGDHLEFLKIKRIKELELMNEELKIKRLNVLVLEKELAAKMEKMQRKDET
ncbi:hypothetical protein M8J76_017382 [Diaphorina citri]|nr:hypothetical protein M8J75_010216 [Diaphorina citri]KAI5737846.1 hypothetical protein M8J76_017382 [Diaphorina citri]KAI5742327.1 hypothetical protein M8J77_006192 [Diaphorina citri]